MPNRSSPHLKEGSARARPLPHATGVAPRHARRGERQARRGASGRDHGLDRGQIKNDDSANDVRDCDLSRCDDLFGPIEIQGAEPGDLLVVDILDIARTAAMIGLHGIFSVNNGGRVLTDIFADVRKAIWDFHGIYATSRHIRACASAGITHPGRIGCAPSHDLLARWNKREAALIATTRTASRRSPCRRSRPVSCSAR